MKIINLYVCEICGKESRVLKTMQKHEKECIKKNNLKPQRSQLYREELKHFQETLDLDNIKDVVNDFVEKMFDDHFDDLNIIVNFNENASNTHYAPIGGITNWDHKPNLPSGYPAFIGRIRGSYSKKHKTIHDYCNYVLHPIPIHPGGGSGDSGSWEYDVTLFISDFDKLTARVAKLYLQKA